MAEHISKAAGFLLALLFLSCEEKQKLEPVEPPNVLDCSTSCDDGKIKAWYLKEYGEPITEFELSARKVYVGIRSRPTTSWVADGVVSGEIGYSYTLARTATGAIAELANLDSKVEFGMEEWLDFIRNLSKHRVGEWEKNNENIVGKLKSIYITFSDEGESPKPPIRRYEAENGGELDEAATYMIKEKLAAMKRVAEFKLSVEYQRKFGELITDFELSTTWIGFVLITETPFTYYDIGVSRDMTETNAKASFLEKDSIRYCTFKAGLGMGDWLDFLHALRKTRFYRWKGKGNEDREKRDGIGWGLCTVNSDSSNILKYYEIKFNNYPKDYGEFKKAMDDMAAKIKEKAHNKNDKNICGQWR